jgi:hypothetical protein
MPIYSQARYGPRDPREGNDPWKYSKEAEKSDPAASTRAGLKRNLDVWDFENNLAEVCLVAGIMVYPINIAIDQHL